MILPNSQLKQIEWYESRQVPVPAFKGYETEIVLHYFKWWKRSKTLRFPWIFVGRNKDDNTTSWQKPQGAIELEKQLKEHIENRWS